MSIFNFIKVGCQIFKIIVKYYYKDSEVEDMCFPSRTEIEQLQRVYHKGLRVKLLKMNDSYSVEEGTLGTVQMVDDAGTIHVKWDNGRRLGVVLEAGDRVEVIK